MPTPAKEEAVQKLNELFQNARSAILTDYQNIDSPSITAFRAHVRGRSVEFCVVKNTLAKKAAKNTPFELLDDKFKGPVSLVVSRDDLIAPAKALSDYAKTGDGKSPKVLCGLVEGKVITPEEVKALADLPSKEELISSMLSVFQGPSRNFACVFASLLRKLVGTLDAVREKKASG